MANAPVEDRLSREWETLQKDWYSLYQWQGTAAVGHTERIAKLILDAFDKVGLLTADLRETNFNVNHQGHAQLNNDVAQFTEKRFCRALFNEGNIDPLGCILDYEVPLGEFQAARHGDIDLLSEKERRTVLLGSQRASLE